MGSISCPCTCEHDEPVVPRTTDATEITSTSARLNAVVHQMWGVSSAEFNFAVASRYIGASDSHIEASFFTEYQTVTGAGTYFSTVITGLVPGTEYMFQAIWREGGRQYLGNRNDGVDIYDIFITTPIIETIDATEISGTSATLNGNLPGDGTEMGPLLAEKEVYFQWGTESGAYTAETPKQTKIGPGDFSAEITGLSPGNRYYFVARAVWDDSTILLGSEMSFYTGEPTEVTVETLDPSGITGSSATLNGNLVNMAGQSSVPVYFKWGTSPGSYPNETPVQTMTSTGTFSAEITALSAGDYYYVARAGDTGQGAEESFGIVNPADGTVETLGYTYYGTTLVLLLGNLTDLAGNPSVEVYFGWGTSSGVYTHETPHQPMTATGGFNAQVMGPFTPGNTYYYIARVGVSGRGEEKSFYAY